MNEKSSPITDLGSLSTNEAARLASGETKSSDPAGLGEPSQDAIPRRSWAKVNVARFSLWPALSLRSTTRYFTSLSPALLSLSAPELPPSCTECATICSKSAQKSHVAPDS